MKGGRIVKKIVCFGLSVLLCMMLSNVAFAKEKETTPKDLEPVIVGSAADETNENNKQKNESLNVTFQFVDTEGKPVPYLYFFDPQDDSDQPMNGWPSGTASKPDGTWTFFYSSYDDNGQPITHITFTARNLYEKINNYQKTYEIPLPINQNQPVQLVWDKPTPMNCFNKYTHKLTIHIQDEKGNPVPNATINLYKPEYRWYDFSFNAVTDSNGNYYTNLYDDVVYRAAVRCPHPTLTCIDRSFQLDATKGGTITKTFVIKDWDKQSDETSKGKAMA